MTQEDIIKVLEKNKDLSAEEISQMIEANTTAVRKCLNRMLKYHEVKRINLTKKQIKEVGKSFSGRHYVWELEDEI